MHWKACRLIRLWGLDLSPLSVVVAVLVYLGDFWGWLQLYTSPGFLVHHVLFDPEGLLSRLPDELGRGILRRSSGQGHA